MSEKDVYMTRRQDMTFVPSTIEDWKKLNDVKPGETIKFPKRKPRNPKNHRRFFAMLKLFANNIPEGTPARYSNPDYLRYEALIACGYCEWRESLKGTMYPVPLSMAFDSMDEDKFQEVYGTIVNYLLKWFSDMDLEEFEKHLNLLT